MLNPEPERSEASAIGSCVEVAADVDEVFETTDAF